jgi:nucleoside-diphosphate-sugar epimerase
VAGPHDNQNGLTYYVRRAARGGQLALPGDPEQPVQLIDSRDLAGLVDKLVTDDRGGAFHAVGPEPPPAPDRIDQASIRWRYLYSDVR